MYENLGSAGAYSGRSGFRKALDSDGGVNISEKKLDEFLKTRDDYTTHRPLRHRFSTQKIWVGGIDQLHQGDLMDMSGLAKKNNGVTFVLAIIDCFSRMAFVQPLLNKSANEMLKAMKKIYGDGDGEMPLKFMSDSGKEFTSKKMQEYFRENEVEFMTPFGNTKCAFVERFIETFKRMIWRYMTDNATYKYVDVLQDLVKSYNNSYHRSIGMSPSQVSEQNAKNVFTHMYGNPLQSSTTKKKHTRYKFKVGDHVRVAVNKGPFEKGYTQTYSSEIYEVVERLIHIDPVQYRIKSLNGDIVKGKFYPQELIPVTYDANKTYPVEKVLAREKRNGVPYVKVKWLGWDKSYNSWIPADQLVVREGPTI